MDAKIILSHPDKVHKLRCDAPARIGSMLRTPNRPFALCAGSKKLVKRKEFEQHISDKFVI